jgi:hypothetical protein
MALVVKVSATRMSASRISTALLPALCRVALSCAGWAVAQETPPPIESATNDASIKGLKNARVISLAIPAPRGQILDREGEPLAQNRVT